MTNDIDICCECQDCVLRRDLKGIPEPTRAERRAAMTRLILGKQNGPRDSGMKHIAEQFLGAMRATGTARFFTVKPEDLDRLLTGGQNTPREASWRAPINEAQRKYNEAWNAYDPSMSKNALILSVFEQLRALLDDGGWIDGTDKRIALLRLAKCRLLWEGDVQLASTLEQ